MVAPTGLPSRAFLLEMLAEVIEAEMAYTEKEFFRRGGKYHTKAACKVTRQSGGPKNCIVHNPSKHHMDEWTKVSRASTLIERTCPHGIGHPDPDSMAYLNWRDGHDAWGVHGCDGCCTPPRHPDDNGEGWGEPGQPTIVEKD